MNKRYIKIFIVIGFCIFLYLVGSEFCGSKNVANYNQGYGTFDMKEYDYQKVTEILGQYEEGGIEATFRYYCIDFTFILFFGATQLIIINAVLGEKILKEKKWLKRLLIATAVARGLFDIIENILLMITIAEIYNVNKTVVTIASICSKNKMISIIIWLIFLAFGGCYRWFRRNTDRSI